MHRDIKPAEHPVGADDETRLVDFGLASVHNHTGDGSRLTKSGLLIGTPEYMAPEQITDEAVDHRADLYSLGIVMYEMFSGEKPFVAETPVKILFQHLEGDAVAADPARSRDSPTRSRRSSRGAMARDPNGRPADAPRAASPHRPRARSARGLELAMARIDAFLQLGREQGCSDIHITVGRPPLVRLDGRADRAAVPPAARRGDRGAAARGARRGRRRGAEPQRLRRPRLRDRGAAAASASTSTASASGSCAICRVVPDKVPSLRDLALPPVLSDLTALDSGLVLVTGGPGTGKTTTLAGDDRRDQRQPELQHHHARGPGRVPARVRAIARHAAPDRPACAAASTRASARRCARIRT